jgi:chemotaxis family two-component system response regulator Rcp1
MVAKQSLTVILAEDNPGDVFLVKAALQSEKLDAELMVKKDGKELLSFLEKVEAGEAACPDVVLLDLNLPKYSGALLLEKLREGICREVPVVIVTSSDSPRDREVAKRFRASGYFRKPTDYDEFMKLGGIVRAVAAR